MAANLPVAFGALLAGGLLLEHGISTAKIAFAGGSTAAAAASTPGASAGAIVATKLGLTTNPVPGASPGRLDQGLDGTARTFLAPFAGTIVKSEPSDPGWNGGGYVAVQSDADPGFVYYAAEGLTPTVSQGAHVTAGEQIGTPRANPYNGIVGNFEIGRADPADPGRPLAQVISNPAAMVEEFYQWMRSLGSAPATSTSGAGFP